MYLQKFFVRCLKQDGGVKFVCPRSKGCQITKDTRTQCQYCRYQKCVEIGMYRPGEIRALEVELPPTHTHTHTARWKDNYASKIAMYLCAFKQLCHVKNNG